MLIGALLASLAPDQITAVQPPIDLVAIKGHGSVHGFKIGKTEVTVAQYAAFVKDTGYDGGEHGSSKEIEPFLNGWMNGRPPEGRDKHPVCNLNWHNAQAFCDWLARKSGRAVRLPSDAEWTLAAAGPEGRTFPWGEAWDIQKCNSGTPDDGFAEAAPVGSFPKGATPEGVLDMAGNIWEWTADKSLRGGPWCMGEESCRTAFVAREDTERCDDKFGFRVCVGG